MFSRKLLVLAASAAAISAMPGSANAEVLKFHVALDGKSGPEPTGSPATGTAKVEIAGSGNVEVSGGAKCNSEKHGSGEVTCS